MKHIGLIGLGNMGLPMALNLKANGDRVVGFDIDATARDAALQAGLEVADDLSSSVTDVDAAIMMLPNGQIALDVASQLLNHMPGGSLLIDSSTIDVTSAREIHVAATDAGKLCLDAPVSGGVSGARAGTLTFMVGGTEDAFAVGSPMLSPMGQKAVHCGDAGAGQAAKICNNMLAAISMIGTSEAFTLAEKLGLDQARLFDVISTSSGSCWSVTKYCPVRGVGPMSPADNDYQPGFSAALMYKDLGLAMGAASDVDAPTIMGERATSLVRQVNELGYGDRDFSVIIKLLSKLQ